MALELLKGLKGISMFSDITKPSGYFDTGIVGLNYIVSGDVNKGYPWGRMIELFGKESCGKSTLAYAAIAKAQQSESLAYLFDTEGAFDISQAQRCGIDPDNLLYDEPKNIDELFKKLYNVLEEIYTKKKATIPMLIVWDSVAASSLIEDESSFDSGAVAQLARKISPAVNRIMPSIIANPVTFLCVNQTRVNLSGWRPTEDTPGGKTIKFYSSIRLQINKKEDWVIKGFGGDDKAGIISNIKCVKNKISRPFLTTSVHIGYADGVDEISSLYELAKEVDIFKQAGSYVKFNDENKRRDEWVDLLRSDYDFRSKIKSELNQSLSGLKAEEAVEDEE